MIWPENQQRPLGFQSRYVTLSKLLFIFFIAEDLENTVSLGYPDYAIVIMLKKKTANKQHPNLKLQYFFSRTKVVFKYF